MKTILKYIVSDLEDKLLIFTFIIFFILSLYFMDMFIWSLTSVCLVCIALNTRVNYRRAKRYKQDDRQTVR